MKKIILMWLLLFAHTFIFAQVITIVDKESKQPLEMVTIVADNSNAFAITNAKGEADITAFKGANNIEIRLVGYKTMKTSFEELEGNWFKVNLSESAISLDQVVVSATRWSERKRDIPAKISTISAAEIALQNPQTAADLLGSSGEVFIQKSQQGGGSPMIRGFSTNRLLLVVDGVRMNTAIFRSGNLQNVISIDPFAVENTEVFFGPGSVIYGSDAIGGVMSFQTLTPDFSLSSDPLITGSALGRFSTANNERSVHFDVNVGWEKWAMTTSFSNNNYGDLRMGSNGPDEYLRPFYVKRIDGTDVVVQNEDPLVQNPTGYQQTNLMQKLRFKPNNNWDFVYGFHYSATTDYARYDRHIRLRDGMPRSAEWNYGPQVWMMNNLNIAHTRKTALFDQMTIRLAQQYFEESRIDRDFNGVIRNTNEEQVDAYSANVDFHKSLNKTQQLFYGVEAVLNEVTSTGVSENIISGERAASASRYPKSTWSSYGAYLNYKNKLHEKVTLQAGARYNYFMLDAVFNTDFFPFPFTEANLGSGSVTGSLGLVYNPTEKWSISANASTGFRAPNVDDVGKVFDSEPGAVVIPNPDLVAEYAYNAEVGVAKVFGDAVKVDLTGFYTILDNALVRRDYHLNGMDSIMYQGELSQVQAIQNAAVASVYGVQAGIEIKLPGGFGISSQFNFQKGEEELDNGETSASRHAAPMFGMTHFTYTAQKLKLDLYAVYSDEASFDDLPEEERGKTYMYAIDANGNPYSPAWYTLNFKANYKIMDHLSVSAGVENLTDQRYRPYSSGIVAAGRNVVLSLKAHF